jgi:hypothetical protein
MLSNERIREIAAAMKSFNVDSMLTWYSRVLDVFADVAESYPVLQKTSLQFYAYTFQRSEKARLWVVSLQPRLSRTSNEVKD